MKKVEFYMAEDGSVFPDHDSCMDYEGIVGFKAVTTEGIYADASVLMGNEPEVIYGTLEVEYLAIKTEAGEKIAHEINLSSDLQLPEKIGKYILDDDSWQWQSLDSFRRIVGALNDKLDDAEIILK